MPFASLSAIAILGGAIGIDIGPATPVFPSPLTRAATPFSDRDDVNAVASIAQWNDAAWDAIVAHEIVTVTGVPLGPLLNADLVLRRVDALAPGAQIVAMVDGPKGPVAQAVAPPPVVFYAGSIAGAEGSRAFIAHGSAFTHGYAVIDDRTFIISSGPPLASAPIASYELSALPHDAIIWSPFECATVPAESVPQGEGGLSGATVCRHVKIALDSDNELAADFGGDITSTASYMLLQAAAMSEIYASNLDVRIQASYLRIWTTTDPWTQGNSVDQLYEFRDHWEANMGAVTRDVAMLLSSRGLGGGVAWLSAMCGPWAYSVSGNLAAYFPYPLLDNNGQNWDIVVTSHELGHNMGTPHTHNFCPPVDQCAPSGYFGNCQTEQVCTSAGTIMSYCHLCGGGLSNISIHFAPACIDAMESHLVDLPCPLAGEPQTPWAVADFVAVVSTPVSIDVLANDLPVNCESVVIDSFSQPPAGQGSVTRLVGAGPGGRDLLEYTGPSNLSGAVEFTYTLRDEADQVGLPGTVRVEKSLFWPATGVIGASAKVAVSYYDLVSPQSLPDFAALNAYLSSTTSTINFPSTGGVFANSNRSDNFGAVWTGWLSIPADGVYTLYLNSDDGSKLWIDGTPLIDNDGLHGMVEKSAAVPLAAGLHALRVEFFEAGGGAGCILSWSGPGLSKTTVPASAFSNGGIVLVADFNGDGAVDGDDLGTLLGDWGPCDGCATDLNGDGAVDGDDLGALLGSWTG